MEIIDSSVIDTFKIQKMKKKSGKILLIAALLVVIGAGIKIGHFPYGDWIIIAGMALGLFGMNTYFNEIKKEH